MKAFWTNTALVTLGQIIIYLEDEWSVQEILDFMDQVDKCVGLLEANPELGRVYNFTHFRQLLVVRQVYIFYSTDDEKDILVIHGFWNNHKDPNTLGGVLLP